MLQVGAINNNGDWAACLWRVVPALKYVRLEEHCAQNQRPLDQLTTYSSVSSLLEMLQVSEGFESVTASTRPSPEQQLRVLAIQHEVKGNTETLAETIKGVGPRAKELSYGDVVQLQHVRTGLFLCVQNIAADVDGEEDDEDNAPRRLHLHVGCEGCHLSVVPHGFIPRKTVLESGRRPISYNDSLCLATDVLARHDDYMPAHEAERQRNHGRSSVSMGERPTPFARRATIGMMGVTTDKLRAAVHLLPSTPRTEDRVVTRNLRHAGRPHNPTNPQAPRDSFVSGVIALDAVPNVLASPPSAKIYELAGCNDRSYSFKITAYSRMPPTDSDMPYNVPFFLYSILGEGLLEAECTSIDDEEAREATRKRQVVSATCIVAEAHAL